MARVDLKVTVASWEDRWALGIRDDLRYNDPARVVTYFVDRYANWTEEVRRQMGTLCTKSGARFELHELSADYPAKNWAVLKDTLCGLRGERPQVLVDLTTMPRDIIWMVLWFLDYAGAKTSYVYHRPKEYSTEWLSRDPQKPRLVYKLSGTPQLGARTVLLVLAGYDVERTAQLIRHYEPSITLLGLQLPGGDVDNDRRMKEHRERFESDESVSIFEVDAYAGDHGQSVIRTQIADRAETHNVIMSSLGPKPTAVAMYRIQRGDPRIGLAYAPSREFNKEYSSGIGRTIRGVL